MKTSIAPVLVASIAAFGALGCGDDPHCDAGELSEALADAEPGDTVEVGACSVRGSFSVPAGVQLVGTSTASSRIVGGGGVALRVDASASGSAVMDLSIESGDAAGIIIIGGADARLERVEVIASRGLGVGVADVASLALVDVTIRGPVTAASADDLPADARADEVATRGLVVSGVADARLERLDVSGFAEVGALLAKSKTRWSLGGARENVGAGLMVVGGEAELTGVALATTLQGTGLLPAYAGVFADGAVITSSSLAVTDSEALGLLHAGAGARHVSLVASGNRDSAVRVQSVKGFSLEGADFEGNRVAGLVIIDSSDVDLADVRVAGTELAKAAVGATGTPDIGDGIQLLASTGVSIRDTTLEGNGRVGILVGAAGESLGVSFENVRVDGEGAELGAIAQRDSGVLAPGSGWDEGIERAGATAENDVGVTSPLEELGIVGPEYVPAADVVLP